MAKYSEALNPKLSNPDLHTDLATCPATLAPKKAPLIIEAATSNNPPGAKWAAIVSDPKTATIATVPTIFHIDSAVCPVGSYLLTGSFPQYAYKF